MFERFTELAHRAVILAEEEARKLNHNYVGSEHVLLSLLIVENEQPQYAGPNRAALALERMGVSANDVRVAIIEEIGKGIQPPRKGDLLATPRLKMVFELSLREALTLGHNYIGPEHILLALFREDQNKIDAMARSMAVKILSRLIFSFDSEVAHQIVREVVAENPYTAELRSWKKDSNESERPKDSQAEYVRLQRESEFIETKLLPEARAEVERLIARRDELVGLLANANSQ